jgi:RNA polymerase sigma-54 factor
MSMEIKLHLKMSQQLRMTPQLQQAIKLLQLSKLELVDLIQKEMVENPVLEEAPEEVEKPPRVVEESEPPQQPENAEQSADKAVKEIDWDAYLENYSGPVPGNSYRGMHDDLPGLEATLTESEDLVDHLLWQLKMNASCEDELAVGKEIIFNLNEKGYLVGVTMEGIAERCDVHPEYVEDVLEYIQEFDPVGVAARDLRECLAVQARHFHPDDDIVLKVIQTHLKNLESRKIKVITKDLKVSEEEVIRAARCLAALDPAPGAAYNDVEPVYIVPDIYVHKLDDGYVCVLNEDGMPKLRVSEYYRQALQNGEAKEAKTYIREKLRSAWWLIRSIHQRQRTIVRVTESIIRFQRRFLDEGVAYLRPLVLRDVAEDIGVHESTVSRVTTNKYVHTPQGIFELKYFFNSAIGRSDGSDTASESVKMRIKKIIEIEDHDKPLSDQKIANLLAEEGIEIARRTVAKYREMLGILKSSQRKRLF